jgi:glycosyltransferase involved in cell wall biosynthesis
MTITSSRPPRQGRRRRVLVIEQGDGLWGAQRYLLRLAPLLEARGFEQVLAAPSDSAVARAWRAEGRLHVHFPVPPERKVRRRGDHGPFSPPLVVRELTRTAANARRVAALAATLGADCIHANGHWSHLESALGGRLARLPVVLHLHEVTVPGVAGRLRAAAVRIADASVAVSNAVADCLPRQTRSRITVIHNGVDPISLSPGPARPEVRGELAADPTAPIVLSLCRLDRNKGVDQLVRAVAALDGDLARTQLAVVGSGDLDGRHAARLRELGAELLGARVRFLGPRPDVAALLRSADVFALASSREGLPLAVLEAQACGTPVVAYPATGTTEIVRDGETGLLARQDDPAHLAACIGRVLTDAGLRTRLAGAARAQVVASFTLAEQVEHQVQILDRLIAGHRRNNRRPFSSVTQA